MIKIIPVVCSSVNWDHFVTECNLLLGRSPTRSLDANHLPAGSIDSFLSALDEFRLKDSNPRETSEFTLNHVMITFLMSIDRWIYFSLLEKAFRNIDLIKASEEKNQVIILASATLKNWKEIILNYNDYPEFSKGLWDLFHTMGFGRFYKEYRINQLGCIERRQ